MLKTMTFRSMLMAVVCAISASAHARADEPRKVDVPAGELTVALRSLAEQSGVEFVYSADQLKGVYTDGVSGEYTAEKAVTKLLEGTKLKLTVHGSGALLIAPASSASPSTTSEGAVGVGPPSRGGEGKGTEKRSWWRLAQADTASERSENSNSSETQSTGSDNQLETSSDVSNSKAQEEVVVTGTHIRGADTPSPLIVVDKQSIEATGYSSIQQVTESLPQIFGGGAQRDTSFGDLSNDSRNNISRGATVNMRGLGAHATLVLLDGHRLPGSGPGHFVDISMIPLSVIKRIEILSDGASATYGSDAVAGVVNIVTADRSEGLDLGARHGLSTREGYEETSADATYGINWNAGNLVAAYALHDESNLDTDDRGFSRSVVGPHDLFGTAESMSLFVSGRLDLSERTQLYTRNILTERENDRMFTQSGRTNRDVARSDQYVASAGIRHEVGETWRIDFFGDYADHELRNRNARLTAPRVINLNNYDQSNFNVEALADGWLWNTMAGDVRLAVGASYRGERFAQVLSSDPVGTAFSGKRHTAAGFAELKIPVLGRGSALGRIEASLAARYEDHSDFGSTTNPKLGLIWEPLHDLRLRATYGESFRAPTFTEIVAQYELSQLRLVNDPTSPTGSSLTLYRPYGANPNLEPETAETWSLGLDYAFLRDSTLSLTWFKVSYSDRISQPFAVVTNVLQQESLYAPVIDRTPEPALVAELIAQSFTGASGFLNSFGAFDPADIAVIIDNRYSNISESNVEGIDASFAFNRAMRTSHFRFLLNVAYLFDLDQRLISGAPANSLLNAVGQPVDLRVRADAGFKRGPLSLAAAVNYTDSYLNFDSAPVASVNSWTTVDLSVAVEPAGSSWLAGTRVAINVRNALDESPPFVGASSNLQLPIGYDPTNADPLGRVVSLELRKRF